MATSFSGAGLSTLSKVEGYFEKVGGERRAKQGETNLGRVSGVA